MNAFWTILKEKKNNNNLEKEQWLLQFAQTATNWNAGDSVAFTWPR